MKPTLSILAALLVVLFVPSRATAQDPPDPALWDKGASRLLVKGYQQGEIELDTRGRQVEITWYATAYQGPGPLFLEDDGVEEQFPTDIESQVVGVRYWPYEVCIVDADTLLVAGGTSGGATVIEKWGLGWPPALPAPIVDANGNQTVPAVEPDVSSVVTLYNGNVQGRTGVRGLSRIRTATGPSTAALVQFADSGDLYRLHLGTGSLQLIASATSSGGTLGTIPELGTIEFSGIEQAVHVSEGTVYLMAEYSEVADVLAQERWMILVDADSDGTLDSWQVLTEQPWIAAGWSDPASYTGE